MNKGKIILLSGPSGVGKGSIWEKFSTHANLQKYKIEPSVSVTTRSKRPNEVNGKSYFFVSKKCFLEYIKEGLFLEHEEYAGNYYGTLKKFVDDKLEQGINIFLEIEVKGAKKIISKFKNDIISIFVMPPSIEALFQRINSRKTNSKDDIDKRLQIAKQELSEAPNFKFRILNDNLLTCVKNFENILKENLRHDDNI